MNYWIDFIIVLKCINNDFKWFYIFEFNCFIIICNGLFVLDWRYINRDDNSVDDVSKGLRFEEMVKNNRWLYGFIFFWKEEDCWFIVIEVF